ncbi:MAG: ATP-binding cassette domain-containing protein [Bacteroidetes bacterium]|nr:ATP-binding cassette domain-containing protein [Bacteroidota bacterium]
MAEVIIRYNHVDIHQSSGLILSDVTFEIEKGEFVYLIGRTGSGKTSLLKTLYADVPVKTGEATICGFDMTNIRKRDIPLLRRKLGIVFQDFQLLNDRTVAQNLEFVLRATGWENKDTIAARIDEVMTEVGVPDKGGKMPYQLSGGEQQRVVIARALMNNPPVIIADEPTANLDPETAADIMNLLIRINREHDTAVLMATHNYQVIERYPAKIFNCQNGTIIVERGIVLK